jgi:hypothetical protein
MQPARHVCGAGQHNSPGALSSPLTPVPVMSILLFCVLLLRTPQAALVISYTSYAFFPLPLSTVLVLAHNQSLSVVALLLSRGFASEIFSHSQRILRNEIIVLNNYQGGRVLLRWCEFFSSSSLSLCSQPAVRVRKPASSSRPDLSVQSLFQSSACQLEWNWFIALRGKTKKCLQWVPGIRVSRLCR